MLILGRDCCAFLGVEILYQPTVMVKLLSAYRLSENFPNDSELVTREVMRHAMLPTFSCCVIQIIRLLSELNTKNKNY